MKTLYFIRFPQLTFEGSRSTSLWLLKSVDLNFEQIYQNLAPQNVLLKTLESAAIYLKKHGLRSLFFKKKSEKNCQKKYKKFVFQNFNYPKKLFLWFKIEILAAVGLILILHSYHYAVDPHCQNATYWASERWRVS